MPVQTTIDIPDDLHTSLQQRTAAERTSIRSPITGDIESTFRPQPSRPMTGPLVGKKGKSAAGSPDRENPYDVLFCLI
ncbi:MAG TPA: hypothetical protein VN924_03140 [Bryobacteraceae bacterium]|nr:hypothetical protein [Bryobacteraceae bacterium]